MLSVEAFNLLLSTGDLRATPERLRKFEEVERTANLARETAIGRGTHELDASYGRALNDGCEVDRTLYPRP